MGLVQQAKDWLINKLGGYTEDEITGIRQAAYAQGYSIARKYTR